MDSQLFDQQLQGFSNLKKDKWKEMKWKIELCLKSSCWRKKSFTRNLKFFWNQNFFWTFPDRGRQTKASLLGYGWVS